MSLALWIAMTLGNSTPSAVDAVIGRLQREGFKRVAVMVDVTRYGSGSDGTCVHRAWEVDADNEHWEAPPVDCSSPPRRR